MFLNVIWYSSGTIISTNSNDGSVQSNFCGSIFTIIKIVKCHEKEQKGSSLFISGYSVKFSNDEFCSKLIDVNNKYIIALAKQLENALLAYKDEHK